MVSQDCKTSFRLRDKTSFDGTINILGCFESQSPPSQAFVCNSTFISARNACKIQNVNPLCADSYNPKDNSSLKVFGCFTFAANPKVEDFRCKNRSGEELGCFIDPTLATVVVNSTNSGEISLFQPGREGSAADPTTSDPKNSQVIPEAREDTSTGNNNGPIWAAVTLGVLLCISLIAIALLLLKLRKRSPKTFADIQSADKVINSKSDEIVAAKLSRRRTLLAKPLIKSFSEAKMPLYSYNFGHAISISTQNPVLQLSTDYDDSTALMLHCWFFSEVRSFVKECMRSSIRNSVFQFLSGQEVVHPQSDQFALTSYISNFVFTNFFASLSSSDRVITFHALLRSVSKEPGAILLPSHVADTDSVHIIFKALLQQFMSPIKTSTPIDPIVHPELLQHLEPQIKSSVNQITSLLISLNITTIPDDDRIKHLLISSIYYWVQINCLALRVGLFIPAKGSDLISDLMECDESSGIVEFCYWPGMIDCSGKGSRDCVAKAKVWVKRGKSNSID